MLAALCLQPGSALAAAAAAGPSPTTTPTLTVTLSGSGSGTVAGRGILCPGICTASYKPGTVLALAPIPAAGSMFAGWGGACSGTGFCTLTISANESVTATFTLSHTLDVMLYGGGRGTVAGAGIDCPGTCSGTYPAGSSVTLSAAAGPESIFSGWGGACSGAGACRLTLGSDESVVATFASQSGQPSAVSAPAAAPLRCKLIPGRAPIEVALPKPRKGAVRKPAAPLGTISLSASCSRQAVVTLRGSVIELVGRKPARGRQRSVAFRCLPGMTVRVRPRVRTVLTTTMPKAARLALRAGAGESATFRLTATAFGATATATATIPRLRPRLS